MPDVITHYLFGLDTSKKLKSSPLYKIIKDNKNVFFIGLQGPDPMYYHRLYKKNSYSYVATLLHNEKPADFLIECVNYAKTYKDNPDIFNPCMSYISGLICHYVLDFTTHPYIFYLGGHFIPDQEETHSYAGLHKKIEVAIDSLLLEEKFGLQADAFKIHKHILKDIAIPDGILKMYDDILLSVFDITGGGKILSLSYPDYRNYFKLTYDRMGTKKFLGASFGGLLPKQLVPFASSFSYHKCYSPYADYMNSTKKVWLHPITGNVYTFSFKDLMHNAEKLASALLLKSYDFVDDKITIEDFTTDFPNLSYTTGLLPTDTRPMKYVSPDYVKL
ncbi:MAG: zinc dependent phospholipase C family protein [Cellulosilyticaceae bacterium]